MKILHKLVILFSIIISFSLIITSFFVIPYVEAAVIDSEVLEMKNTGIGHDGFFSVFRFGYMVIGNLI